MDQFEHLATLSPDLALAAAPALLEQLASNESLMTHLPRATSSLTQPAFSSLSAGSKLSLQLFLWPAGVWTPIHDHTGWGIYRCLSGLLLEDRYERLDEGEQPSRAHLRHAWRALWRPGQQSTLLPYAGGIHRVGNPGDRPSISLHLYGPPQAEIDGRDYDPTRDFVCDRPLDAVLPIAA